MKNSILMSLAFNGVNKETLVENILAMCPSPVIAERMLGGIKIPTLEEVQAKHPEWKVTSVEMYDGFREDCICIKYDRKVTVYTTEDPGFGDKILTYEEYCDAKKKFQVRGCKDDTYKFPVYYWDWNSTTITPENL